MKIREKTECRSRVVLAALLSGALLLGAGNAAAQKSPTGVSWDCLIDGNQGVGVAYINFYDDGTLDGMSIMRPNRPVTEGPTGTIEVGRNSGETDRTGTVTVSTPAAVVTPDGIYGFGPVEGSWNYDYLGRVIGHFTQVIEGTNSTGAVTNSIGFKALVVPGKRLTLAAYGPNNGKSIFRGLPLKAENVSKLNSLTESSWYGAQSGTGQILVEFFNLAPTWQPGAYTLTGYGAEYDVDGWAMMSARGRIGFAVTTNGKLRATVGTFTRRTSRALTTGVIEPGTRLRFNAYQYPIPVTPES